MHNHSYLSSTRSSVNTICSLIDKLMEHRERRFNLIYLSTFQVYGSYTGLINENSDVNPCSIYGLVHLHAEQCLKLYAKQNNHRLTILRPTNIYGTATQSFPYSRKTLVPNCFIEEAINLETITIKASSPVYRNFVSIHKIGAAIKYFANSIQQTTSTINLCGSHTYEIEDVAKIVKAGVQRIKNKQVKILTPNRNSIGGINDGFLVTSQVNDKILDYQEVNIMDSIDDLIEKYYHSFQGA